MTLFATLFSAGEDFDLDRSRQPGARQWWQGREADLVADTWNGWEFHEAPTVGEVFNATLVFDNRPEDSGPGRPDEADVSCQPPCLPAVPALCTQLRYLPVNAKKATSIGSRLCFEPNRSYAVSVGNLCCGDLFDPQIAARVRGRKKKPSTKRKFPAKSLIPRRGLFASR
jgi:hypothetical protein